MAKSKKKDSGGGRSRSRNPLVRHRKALLVGSGIALVLAGGYHLMNLNQLNKELEIEQSAQLWNVSLTGLTVRVDVVLKNPTPGQVQVKTPYITIAYNGTPLASSDTISGTNHLIPGYGTVALDPIYLTLKFLTLAVSAKKFYNEYMSTGRALVTVRALTRINEVFPVEQTTTFDLGGSAPAAGGKGVTGKAVAVPTVASLATSITPPKPLVLSTPKVAAIRAQALALPAARKVTTTARRVAATAKRAGSTAKQVGAKAGAKKTVAAARGVVKRKA